MTPRSDRLPNQFAHRQSLSIGNAHCGRGGIGRRAGLKIRFRKECGFDSHRPHQIEYLLIQRLSRIVAGYLARRSQLCVSQIWTSLTAWRPIRARRDRQARRLQNPSLYDVRPILNPTITKGINWCKRLTKFAWSGGVKLNRHSLQQKHPGASQNGPPSRPPSRQQHPRPVCLTMRRGARHR
jgi:hypothetical protein